MGFNVTPCTPLGVADIITHGGMHAHRREYRRMSLGNANLRANHPAAQSANRMLK